MLFRRTACLCLGIVLITTACKKDDPEIPNEEELITTLKYILTPPFPADPVEFVFRDIDGDGGQSPEIINAVVEDNVNYSATIELLNESESPAEDITVEVMQEASVHQLFFNTSSGLNMNILYDDLDSGGNPLGLSTQCQTGDASSGTLTITLRHEPNKNAVGVANGDITNAGGETDIQVTFNVTIE